MSTKEAIIRMIQSLPDGVTWAEVVAEGAARFGAAKEGDESLTQEEWETAWVDEANRRLNDMRSGKTVGIPAEEVMKELKEKFG